MSLGHLGIRLAYVLLTSYVSCLDQPRLASGNPAVPVNVRVGQAGVRFGRCSYSAWVGCFLSYSFLVVTGHGAWLSLGMWARVLVDLSTDDGSGVTGLLFLYCHRSFFFILTGLLFLFSSPLISVTLAATG